MLLTLLVGLELSLQLLCVTTSSTFSSDLVDLISESFVWGDRVDAWLATKAAVCDYL
jgi:hypothetical protein